MQNFHSSHIQPTSQRGVAAVEFALVASLFFILLFGTLELGRVLWTWNAAVESTRLGARLAVVCNLDDAAIKSRMQERLPALTTSNIDIAYDPAACTAAGGASPACETVTVSLTGYTQQTYIPIVNFAPLLPAFTTTLTRESMDSTDNPVCLPP